MVYSQVQLQVRREGKYEVIPSVFFKAIPSNPILSVKCEQFLRTKRNGKVLGLITDLLIVLCNIYHLVGICDDRRVMLCTCGRHVHRINITLGVAHLLLMTVEGSWHAGEVQEYRHSAFILTIPVSKSCRAHV
jgi:hypothetical protein